MFYVEGSIDSIELEVSDFRVKQFSIVPSSEFLITLPDGKKSVLFVDYKENVSTKDDSLRDGARLLNAKKNENDKEVVCFKLRKPLTSTLIDILIQAKYNHSSIRVCTGQVKDERNNAVQKPDIEDVTEIHLV